MSESGQAPSEEEKNDEDTIKEIEENCWEAFCAFDTE